MKIFFQNIFYHELKILRRSPHRAAAVIAQGHVTGTEDSFGPFFSRPGSPGVIDQLGNIDLHGTHINTTLAHGAHPHPGGLGYFFIHAHDGQSQEFPGVHIFET